MRIVLFGSNGQVGAETRRLAATTGDDLVALDVAECDLTAKGAAAAALIAARPDAVINAAAYTAVDRAETEEALARRINADAPGEMARAAASIGVPFVHFSTDYVFDGSATRPYRETDPTGPLSAYGRTKLEGELRVAEAGGRFAILRTSWAFSVYGANFVKTMLRLAVERPRLRVVADQRGKPTPARALAQAARLAAISLREDASVSGLYHFAGDEETTWADFAAAVVAEAGLKTPVDRIATADYPTPARRPAYSTLDTGAFEEAFSMAAPSWRAALADIVAELAPKPQEAVR